MSAHGAPLQADRGDPERAARSEGRGLLRPRPDPARRVLGVGLLPRTPELWPDEPARARRVAVGCAQLRAGTHRVLGIHGRRHKCIPRHRRIRPGGDRGRGVPQGACRRDLPGVACAGARPPGDGPHAGRGDLRDALPSRARRPRSRDRARAVPRATGTARRRSPASWQTRTTSTSPRATSTPTATKICRCSRSSGTRGPSTRIAGWRGSPASGHGPSAASTAGAPPASQTWCGRCAPTEACFRRQGSAWPRAC